MVVRSNEVGFCGKFVRFCPQRGNESGFRLSIGYADVNEHCPSMGCLYRKSCVKCGCSAASPNISWLYMLDPDGNGKYAYVLDIPRPDGNVILVGISDRICSRRAATSRKTSASLAALYLSLVMTPNRSVQKVRGFPNTFSPRVLYSWMQSRTVIRNLPSSMAISLDQRQLYGKPDPWSLLLTILCWNRRCGRSNDTAKISGLVPLHVSSHRESERH